MKHLPAMPSQAVEPLGLNITLCQVMVALSQRQDAGRDKDADWLLPLRTFVRDTLANGVKLSYKQLHMLLDGVWKMALKERSRGAVCVCCMRAC